MVTFNILYLYFKAPALFPDPDHVFFWFSLYAYHSLKDTQAWEFFLAGIPERYASIGNLFLLEFEFCTF